MFFLYRIVYFFRVNSCLNFIKIDTFFMQFEDIRVFMSCSFFYPCRIFCRVLVIFLYRIKFVFVSYSYRVAVSCPKLSGLKNIN